MILLFLSTACYKYPLKNELTIEKAKFTSKSLKKGKLAIGGVVSLIHEEYSPEEKKINSLTYANYLRIELLDRKDLFPSSLSIFRLIKTMNLLGKTAHQKILEEYKQNRTLNQKQLKKLQNRLTGVRYILFVLLEKDKVKYYQAETDNFFSPATKAQRDLQGLFTIYDLKTMELVWQAYIGRRKISTRLHTRFFIDKNYEFPEPNNMASMTYHLFYKFAKGLLIGGYGADLGN